MATNANDGTLLDVVNNIESAAQNWGVALVVLSVGVGILLVIVAGTKLHAELHHNHHMGQNHSMQVIGYIIAIAIGSFMTIISFVIAYFSLIYG